MRSTKFVSCCREKGLFLSAQTDACRACGRALPPARKAGRPRQYCSSTCRSSGRRARAREAARLARQGGPCETKLAGQHCPRPAEHTLLVCGMPFRLCSACHTMTTQYLLEQQVPATDVAMPLPTPAREVSPAKPAAPAHPEIRAARPTQVLLVEDDDAIRLGVGLALTRYGYTVFAEDTGQAGLRSAYLRSPELVLLDVMLPDIDGYEVLRRLRTVSDVPVIFLTARSESVDVVLGLSSGADDYIVKPCQAVELVARIERVLHRYRTAERQHEALYDDGLLRLDSQRQQAWVASAPLPLSATEFRVLDRLVRHANVVQHFATLLKTGRDAPAPAARDRVKFTVSRLRSKLDGTPVGADSIVSVRGIGYLYRSPTTPPLPPHRRTSPAGGYGHGHTL